MSTRRERLRRRFVLEPLEGRELLSVMIAERENNNRASRANAFAFDADGIAQLQGVSLNRNDRDFFAFTAPASGIRFAPDGSSSGGRIGVEVCGLTTAGHDREQVRSGSGRPRHQPPRVPNSRSGRAPSVLSATDRGGGDREGFEQVHERARSLGVIDQLS